MGFDLSGIKPCAEVGIYFRNNCWWWRPLASYVLDVCADLFQEGETEYWHSNDGQKISAETAQKIAERLHQLFASGAVHRFAEKYEEERKAIRKVVCQWCDGTGDRPDLEPPEWKAQCGGCNSCHGTGYVDDSAANYPFSEENVKEFAEFCENSGGFEIW
jgi:DnaJ-class molecular chaperone